MEEDEEESRRWLRKSAEQGHEPAIEHLLEWFGEGTEMEEDAGGTGTITEETYDSIKTACEVFIMTHDASKFDVSYKLKDTLGILYENIYLVHDDTLFKSGKNGFAITEYGIYCRELMASYTNFVTYEQLAGADNIYISGSYIYADGELIAYMTGDKSVLNDLKGLFEEIALFVSVDLM